MVFGDHPVLENVGDVFTHLALAASITSSSNQPFKHKQSNGETTSFPFHRNPHPHPATTTGVMRGKTAGQTPNQPPVSRKAAAAASGKLHTMHLTTTPRAPRMRRTSPSPLVRRSLCSRTKRYFLQSIPPHNLRLAQLVGEQRADASPPHVASRRKVARVLTPKRRSFPR